MGVRALTINKKDGATKKLATISEQYAMPDTGLNSKRVMNAKTIQEMARKLTGDGSLGINQAAHVILLGLASGDYSMSKKRTPKPKPKDNEE